MHITRIIALAFLLLAPLQANAGGPPPPPPCGDSWCTCRWFCGEPGKPLEPVDVGQCVIDALTKGCDGTWVEDGKIKGCDDIDVLDPDGNLILPGRPLVCPKDRISHLPVYKDVYQDLLDL